MLYVVCILKYIKKKGSSIICNQIKVNAWIIVKLCLLTFFFKNNYLTDKPFLIIICLVDLFVHGIYYRINKTLNSFVS